MKLLRAASVFITLLLLAGAGWGIVWLIIAIWNRFTTLDPNVAVGLLTTSTTILVAVLTIVLGRYFERRKEIEAHFRDKKIAIYDEFLKKFFQVYYGKNPNLVDFFREFQRQAMLWGGSPVLLEFMKWRTHFAQHKPDAQSLYLMEDFFRALRKDIGLSNSKLPRGLFIQMILRNYDLFVVLSKQNPNITLEEMAQKEKELGLEP